MQAASIISCSSIRIRGKAIFLQLTAKLMSLLLNNFLELAFIGCAWGLHLTKTIPLLETLLMEFLEFPVMPKPLYCSLSLPHFLSFCLSKLCLLAYFSLFICNLTLLCISCAFLAPFCFSFLLIFHSFLIFPLAFVPPVYKCPAGVCVYLSVYLSVFATIFQEVFCLETCLYVSS